MELQQDSGLKPGILADPSFAHVYCHATQGKHFPFSSALPKASLPEAQSEVLFLSTAVLLPSLKGIRQLCNPCLSFSPAGPADKCFHPSSWPTQDSQLPPFNSKVMLKGSYLNHRLSSYPPLNLQQILPLSTPWGREYLSAFL